MRTDRKPTGMVPQIAQCRADRSKPLTGGVAGPRLHQPIANTGQIPHGVRCKTDCPRHRERFTKSARCLRLGHRHRRVMIKAIKPHLKFGTGNYVPGLCMTTRKRKFGSLATPAL